MECCNFFFILACNSFLEPQILEIEEASAKVFTEGVTYIEDSLGEKGSGKVLSDIWDHYLTWCVERLEDERSCDALRKKVGGKGVQSVNRRAEI